MKATGITRRIDDLGRIVIPKEIRRTMRIREGDPLEIFTDRDGSIILKKYSLIGEMGEFARQYVDSLAQTTGHIVAVSDRDQIIAASVGVRKDILNKSISKDLEKAIDNRETVVAQGGSSEYRSVCMEDRHFAWEVICPILTEGDAIGSVIILTNDSTEPLGDAEKKLAASAAGFLGRQMEQ